MNSDAICHNSSIRSIIITTFVNMYLKRASMFLMASIAQAVLSSSDTNEATQKDITSTANLDSVNAKLKTTHASSGTIRAVNGESGAIGIAGHPIVSQMVQRKAIDVTNTSVVKLTASDGAAIDLFGWSVSISNGVVVVGASVDDSHSGSAYIFERNTTGTWDEVAKLSASDGAVGANFGWSVSISNGVVVVGAWGDDDNGERSGSAYIFERNTTGTWVEVAKLTASDGAADDYFGQSVSVSDGVVVVGAYVDDDKGSESGSAYIYERNTTGTWVHVAKLSAHDGAAYDYFGVSVSVSNGVVVVGAQDDDDKGDHSGSAYIYERNKTGTWVEVAKLTASDGAADDYFGISVSVSNGTVAVAAPHDDDKGSESGSVYIYERNTTGNWVYVAKLTASDGAADDYFGYSVSVSNGVVVVGAPNDDDKGDHSGSAYIFERSPTGTWVDKAKLTASDGAAGDYFGHGVSVSNGVVVIGAPADDDKGIESGSAYVHELLAASSGSPTVAPTAAHCFPIASKLKIQATTNKPIQLNEVEIISGGSNVAPGKVATQGSTYKRSKKFAASKAIDGDLTTFSHTRFNGCGWLEIDLEAPHAIESFTLHNRGCKANDATACLCRLSHATVSLFDEQGEWLTGIWLNDTCGELSITHNFDASLKYCGGSR